MAEPPPGSRWGGIRGPNISAAEQAKLQDFNLPVVTRVSGI